MNAIDLMTRHPVTVRETATVSAAIRTLRELDVRHLPVISVDGELVGMLSDRDLLDPPPATSVAALMSHDVISVTEETDVEEIIDLLVSNRIGAVPVVTTEGRLSGIVSYVDVLKALGKTLGD